MKKKQTNLHFNDWSNCEIIYKDDIINFEFLQENNLIKEIEDGYYYLRDELKNIEKRYYLMKNKELAAQLNIHDIDVEIKKFIRKLNLYNEIKDIGQMLMGKIADLRGVTTRELHEEFGIIYDE
ncbi:DNA repair protein SWI5 like protein [Astathelohania contejeani]|uniref:DNA repair protein SWI5 like protein n=1 Tax=Astathelohania contejeani TaxID=164912 RepID=A0ABQ7HVR1_9MICR|nr:DNA repair protein SWI5 like protein [Thelohania contejeani]